MNEDMVAIMNEALSAQPAPLAAGEGMDKVREALAKPEFQCALSLAGFHEATWIGDLGDLRRLYDETREALSAQPVCDAGPYGPCPTPDACTCPPVPPRGAQPAPASQEEYWQWHADGSPVPTSDTPKQPALPGRAVIAEYERLNGITSQEQTP